MLARQSTHTYVKRADEMDIALQCRKSASRRNFDILNVHLVERGKKIRHVGALRMMDRTLQFNALCDTVALSKEKSCRRNIATDGNKEKKRKNTCYKNARMVRSKTRQQRGPVRPHLCLLQGPGGG